jgi:multidrug efflux pump subunit AcrA (membrane-fusion protein)
VQSSRLIDAVLFSSLLLCAGCGSSKADAAAKASPAPLHVDTVKAANGTLHATLQIAGVVTPLRQVGIAADLTEPIGDVLVQEGETVHAGQPLAHLLTDDLEAQLASSERVVAEDVARYSQAAYQTNATTAQDDAAVRSAQDNLRQARVSLAGAMTDLKRYETLESSGYLAPATVDQQRTTVASDTAAVNTAQSALNQALANAQSNGRGDGPGSQQSSLQASRAAADAAQASVEQLHRQLARATIVSPIDGVVDAVNANPGEYPSGRQLFTIEQISSVYAVLPSSTAQVVQVRTGAPATIVAAGSTRKDAGNVVAVLDALQPGTTNFTVKVLVPNADGHLHPGMPVSATVSLPAVNGILIPFTAFIDDMKSSVYVVNDGTVATKAVQDVKDDGKNAVVTGLTAGTVVVKDADAANVGNGDTVTTGPTPAPDASDDANAGSSSGHHRK